MSITLNGRNRKKSTTLGVLKCTRAFLAAKENWVQGLYFSASGACCLTGALFKCSPGSTPRHSNWDTQKELSDHIPASFVPPTALFASVHDRLTIFNDDPGTKHSDILALLDRTIADVEKRT